MIPEPRSSSGDRLYLSIGENCLADDILDRHGLKSFSTIYSHGRSNIDYAIQLEKDHHRHLLDIASLYHDHVGEQRVVRNRHYARCSNIYHPLHTNGFEFTHHDVLSRADDRASISRRVSRLEDHRGRSEICFLYHYRLNADFSIDRLLDKAEEFVGFYCTDSIVSSVIVFTQSLVSERNRRGVTEIRTSPRTRVFSLQTLDKWEGDDQGAFWARNDDDLIASMLREVSGAA